MKNNDNNLITNSWKTINEQLSFLNNMHSFFVPMWCASTRWRCHCRNSYSCRLDYRTDREQTSDMHREDAHYIIIHFSSIIEISVELFIDHLASMVSPKDYLTVTTLSKEMFQYALFSYLSFLVLILLLTANSYDTQMNISQTLFSTDWLLLGMLHTSSNYASHYFSFSFIHQIKTILHLVFQFFQH